MRPIEVKAEAISRASPARVYALLKDGSTWPQWTVFHSCEIERPGAEEPLGVGCIRVFRTRYSVAHEKIVELKPDRRLSYELVSGLPLRDYHADVDLEPLADGGTRIRWRSQFSPKHAGTGWFWKWIMDQTLRRVSQDLADGAAASLSPPRGPP